MLISYLSLAIRGQTHKSLIFMQTCGVILTLSTLRGSPLTSKIGLRRSKIYKCHLTLIGGKGSSVKLSVLMLTNCLSSSVNF